MTPTLLPSQDSASWRSSQLSTAIHPPPAGHQHHRKALLTVSPDLLQVQACLPGHALHVTAIVLQLTSTRTGSSTAKSKPEPATRTRWRDD